MNWMIWIGMALCLSQSAMFSGLNLGMLGPSRLRLEIAAKGGNRGAQRVLDLREDFNLLLTTILWGNVAVNTLLAILADSIMTGVTAFVVSTVGITLFGEIVPQAYVSRHAFRVAGALVPVIRVYRAILLPIAWPTARLVDKLVGKEGIGLIPERDIREMLKVHIRDDSSDVSRVEGYGALNFLALDDRRLADEAAPLQADSIVSLPFVDGRARFPEFRVETSDPFVRAIHEPHRKWIVITDEEHQPRLVLNANVFLRAAFLDPGRANPGDYCHAPLVVTDPEAKLETVLGDLELRLDRTGREPLHPNVALLWTPCDKRILTGVDLLAYLLRGIATCE